MSWTVVAIVVGAMVALVVFKRLGSRLSDEELANIREAVAAGARLVDVRTPAEYQGGHIEGALNLPVGELPAGAGRIGKRSRPVVVYCRTGSRSALAASFLRRHGFSTVLDLKTMGNWPSVSRGEHAP